MTDWKHGDADRRSHGNTGLSREVGELQAMLQMHLTQQIQLQSRFQDEMRDQRETHQSHLKEIYTKLDTLSGWKDQMTGGMNVAVLIWRAWAGAVTLYIAWQSFIKQALRGQP